MVLPNFFIVGAAKAGTTTLAAFLREHPKVYVPALKEPHYFCYKEVQSDYYYKTPIVGDWQEYLSLFKSATKESRIGEATVHYLCYPGVAEKIRRVVPNAKVIIMLREPVARAFSHYLMDYRAGRVGDSFEEILLSNRTDLAKFHREYVHLGQYTEQVSEYIDVFGRQSVFVGLFEDMAGNQEAFLKSICDFLGIEWINNTQQFRENAFHMPKGWIAPFFRNYYLRKTISAIVPKSAIETLRQCVVTYEKPSIPPSAHNYLVEMYKGERASLERLLGRSLDKWVSRS